MYLVLSLVAVTAIMYPKFHRGLLRNSLCGCPLTYNRKWKAHEDEGSSPS